MLTHAIHEREFYAAIVNRHYAPRLRARFFFFFFPSFLPSYDEFDSVTRDGAHCRALAISGQRNRCRLDARVQGGFVKLYTARCPLGTIDRRRLDSKVVFHARVTRL